MNTQVMNAVEEAATADPGITAEAIATDRIAALVGDLKRGGLGNLTEMRDAIDDLMRAIEQEGRELTERFQVYAAHVTQAVTMKAIVMQPVNELSEAVAKNLKPKPSKVVTGKVE